MDEPFHDDGISEDVVDAIEALGNRHRLQILVALAAAAWDHRDQRHTLSFTELHDAVDVESSSGFSYHLDQLVGRFVGETPDGYRLTHGGHKIVRTIRSGAYESSSGFEERAIDGVCVLCEEPSLLATLVDEEFRVRCGECESVLLTNSFPRSQARDRTPDGIVASFGHRIWGAYVHLYGSVCPECYGAVDTHVESHDIAGKTLYTHVSTCRECLFTIHTPVELAAAFHPTALQAFWNHGVSVVDVPLWEFFEYVSSDRIETELVSEDPIELACTISVGGESLRFAVGERLGATRIDAPGSRTAD